MDSEDIGRFDQRPDPYLFIYPLTSFIYPSIELVNERPNPVALGNSSRLQPGC